MAGADHTRAALHYGAMSRQLSTPTRADKLIAQCEAHARGYGDYYPALAGALQHRVTALCSELEQYDNGEPEDGCERFAVLVDGVAMMAEIQSDEDSDGWSLVGVAHAGDDILPILSTEVVGRIEGHIEAAIRLRNERDRADMLEAA